MYKIYRRVSNIYPPAKQLQEHLQKQHIVAIGRESNLYLGEKLYFRPFEELWVASVNIMMFT